MANISRRPFDWTEPLATGSLFEQTEDIKKAIRFWEPYLELE